MNYERRHSDERSRRYENGSVRHPQPDGQLALEHVEEVCVMVVDVEVRALAMRREPGPGRVQRVVVGQDLDSPFGRVADDLTRPRR